MQLSAFLNGTRNDYLTGFFGSAVQINENKTDKQDVVLVKVLDLELLAFELPSFEVIKKRHSFTVLAYSENLWTCLGCRIS